MDLAKIGSVWSRTAQQPSEKAMAEINEYLSMGWVLISVKIVDAHCSVFILGKPREKPK